jgi:hypothetical protein
MRYGLFCCLAALVLLAGCPAGKTAGTGTAASPPPPPPAAQQTVAPRQFPLELDSIRLGLTLSEVHIIIDQDPTRRGTADWRDVGQTGVIRVRPASGGLQPAEDFYLQDGKLVGYFKRMKQTDQAYVKRVEQLAVLLDPAQEQLPAWAGGYRFAKALPALAPRDGRLFWQDEGRGQLMLIERRQADDRAFEALFEPKTCEELGFDYPAFVATPLK